MSLNWQIVGIIESRIFDAFFKCHRLQSLIAEELLQKIENDPNYQWSTVSRQLTDLQNQAFLYPIIFSSYSVFESWLKRVLKEIDSDFSLNESLSPFENYSLDQIKDFLKGKDLKNTWQISLWNNELNEAWNNIKLCQKLRNFLIHYDGDWESIPSNDIRKFDNILKLRGISLSPNRTIILDIDYATEYIGTLQNFIDVVIKNYKIEKSIE